ncbi:MAG: hypothetical protein Q9227_002474 [Pyrenula ochraceoflavens]
MADPIFVQRLNSLQQSYKATLASISKLQKLPATSNFGQQSDPRLEIAAEIHANLKEQERDFEGLQQEFEDDPTTPVWVGGGSVRRRSENAAAEKERIRAQVTKLGEDLKAARASFRRAQLQAKRNSDAEKLKERQRLFSKDRSDSATSLPPRGRSQKTLTQDELTMQASNDVTAALRRTHQMMQDSIEQSQFAQQTFDTSSSALKGLDEQYSNLDTMLNSTKSLVSSLLRSQKSDTWYLETAFYILVVTIGWLLFRRIFYGPLWWLVWQPIRWATWLVFSVLSSIGILGGHKTEMVSSATTSRSLTVPPQATGGFPERQQPPGRDGPFMVVGGGGKGGGWGHQRPQEESRAKEDSETPNVDEIGRIIDHADKQFEEGKGGIDDISSEERMRQEEIPRNPKKRMWEQEKQEDQTQKDEL